MARVKAEEKNLEEIRAREVETKGLPSASGFDAEIRCLGKRQLCAQLPGTKTKFAKDGQKIHEALHLNDTSDLSKSHKVTAERIMFYEAELVEALEFEGSEVIAEQRLWMVDDELEPAWSARIDSVHLQRKKSRALVINFKTGYGDVVDLRENWQVIAECAAVLAAYGVREIIGALIHPHHPDKPYQYRIFKVKELEEKTVTLNVYSETLAKGKDLERTPNAISCRFCDAKYACQEYAEKMDRTGRMVKDARDGKAARVLMNKTPEERGIIIRDVKQLARDVDEFLGYCKDILQRNSKSVAGYVLRPNMSMEIKDELKAIQLIKAAYGKEALAGALTLSVKGLEDWLVKVKKFSKKDAHLRARQILKPETRWKHNEPTLEIKRN